MFSYLSSLWNEFFFARIGSSTGIEYDDANPSSNTKKKKKTMNALYFIGYLRIAYGVCILLDRIVLSFDFNMFFLYNIDHYGNLSLLPMIPCQQYMKNVQSTLTHDIYDSTLPNSPLCSLAAFLPISYHSYLYWTFHIISIINAVLLILGVYPKIQLLFLHINMISLHYHNSLLWDGEDVMFKMWNFLFIFLPLHHVTVYDIFGISSNNRNINNNNKVKKDEILTTTTTTTYPIWPIRLFQIELCCIYAGAGYSKLSTSVWRTGNALYHVIHEKDFFGGPYVPEFIFHYYGPLKLATWSSLLLECICIFFVWSSNRTIKYFIVYNMIALHIGIELTMNMHVFEWLSIIGWCMFFIEPSISYKEYSTTISSNKKTKYKPTITTTSSTTTTTTKKFDFIQFYHHQWFISIFLFCIITIFVIDTIPLLEIYNLINDLIVPLFNTSSSTIITTIASIISNIQSLILSLYYKRHEYFVVKIMHPYAYPIGIYQAVWNLYSGAPDLNCRFTTMITTYTTTNNNINNDRNTYSYISPDWGNMTWYEKKRYQRPMTMQEKLGDSMCRDCYVKYHANHILQDIVRNDTEKKNYNSIQLASAILSMQCEYPRPPPEVDDWFNWSGWFYANAKQEVLLQSDPVVLYTMNICNDLNVGLCQQWYNEGLCNTADYNPTYRHSLKNGTILTDRDAFVYNITQTCRQSCSYCPEHGYDVENLPNGTRISIFWPLPTWDKEMNYYTYEPNAMYYDGTIIKVQDSPIRQYLLKYDDTYYNDEWFDAMILRDRGYRFVPEYVPTTTGTTSSSNNVDRKTSEDDEDDLNNSDNNDEDDNGSNENDRDEL